MGGKNYALFENGAAYPVIFAGGTINADLYARNSVSDPIGGRIGRVGAHGDIDGLFKAESSIDEVFSAGDIFAILDAPLVYPPRENDASVITEYPLPDTPASIRDDVLAEGAAAYAEVLEARDELDATFEASLAKPDATFALGRVIGAAKLGEGAVVSHWASPRNSRSRRGQKEMIMSRLPDEIRDRPRCRILIEQHGCH